MEWVRVELVSMTRLVHEYHRLVWRGHTSPVYAGQRRGFSGAYRILSLDAGYA